MKTILSVIIAIVSVLLIVTVASMESEQAGLGTLDGSVETSWGEHTGASKKQKLNKLCTIASVVFVVALLILLAI